MYWKKKKRTSKHAENVYRVRVGLSGGVLSLVTEPLVFL